MKFVLGTNKFLFKAKIKKIVYCTEEGDGGVKNLQRWRNGVDLENRSAYLINVHPTS